MATIELKREKGFKDAVRAYKVELDGQVIVSISGGESVSFNIQPGAHRLRLKIDWCGSNPVGFQINEGQVLSFECGNNVPSFLELIYVIFLRNKYLWLKPVDRAGPGMAGRAGV